MVPSRRILRRRKLNKFHATTRELPNELLSLIFEAVLDSVEHLNFYRNKVSVKFNLCAVCYLWREVALTTPTLWTFVPLRFREGRESDVQSEVDFLKLHLQKSGILGLDIGFNFHCRKRLLPKDTTVLLDSSVDYEIIQNLSRIIHLHLRNLSQINTNLWMAMAHEMPRLETFEIDACDVKKIDLISNVLITRARFWAWSGGHIDLHWKSIRYLDLFAFPVDLGIQLLLNCHNLCECSLRIAASPSRHDVSAWEQSCLNNGTMVTLPHLKKLTWCYGGDRLELVLFRYLNVPSLSELNWQSYRFCSGWPRGHLDVLKSFCQRLPSSIHTLGVETIFSRSNLFELLPNHLSVEKLILDCFSYKTLKDCVSLLGRTYVDEKGNEGMMFPGLVDLKISTWDMNRWRNFKPEPVSELLEILEKRGKTEVPLTITFHGLQYDLCGLSFSPLVSKAISSKKLVIQVIQH